MRRHMRIKDVVELGGDVALNLNQFLDDFRHEERDRASLIADEPMLTGDSSFDARLAATAESLARESGIEVPDWVWRDARYVDEPVWAFQGHNPEARIYLRQTTPPEFASRNHYTGDNVLARC